MGISLLSWIIGDFPRVNDQQGKPGRDGRLTSLALGTIQPYTIRVKSLKKVQEAVVDLEQQLCKEDL